MEDLSGGAVGIDADWRRSGFGGGASGAGYEREGFWADAERYADSDTAPGPERGG